MHPVIKTLLQKQLSYNFYTFIFAFFSSDTIQVLMFVCPTVSEIFFMDVVILVILNEPNLIKNNNNNN